MDLKGLGKALAKEAKSGVAEVGGFFTKGISALGEGINKGADMANRKLEKIGGDARSDESAAQPEHEDAPVESTPVQETHPEPAPVSFKAEPTVAPPVRIQPEDEPLLAKAEEPAKAEELPRLKVMSSRNAANIRDSVRKTESVDESAEEAAEEATEEPEVAEAEVEAAEEPVQTLPEPVQAEPEPVHEPEPVQLAPEPVQAEPEPVQEAPAHEEPEHAADTVIPPKINRVPLKVKAPEKAKPAKPAQKAAPEPEPVKQAPAESAAPAQSYGFSLDSIGRTRQCRVCGAIMQDDFCQNCERNNAQK